MHKVQWTSWIPGWFRASHSILEKRNTARDIDMAGSASQLRGTSTWPGPRVSCARLIKRPGQSLDFACCYAGLQLLGVFRRYNGSRLIEASICLLDCRLAKIGNPGRRQGSAAPTSEALLRRKGWFPSVGKRGECRNSKQQRSGSTTRTNSKGYARTPSMPIKVRTAHLALSWKSLSSLKGIRTRTRTRWI